MAGARSDNVRFARFKKVFVEGVASLHFPFEGGLLGQPTSSSLVILSR